LKSIPPHPALVTLIEVIWSETQLMLVFELCELNLREWLDKHGPLRGSALAGAARQLFAAIEHIHANGVMHRDIKPQNFLIKEGKMKLADFGLAKRQPMLLWQQPPLTMQVASLWYRAPEIMLGAERYDATVDIWAAGCVLFETLTGNVMFQGESEISTLFKMFMRLGTPGNITHLPHYSHRFPKWSAHAAKVKLTRELAPEHGCTEVLLRCVQFEPITRISASTALADDWLARTYEVTDSPSPLGLF
jgi:serine/threonine protein kinase